MKWVHSGDLYGRTTTHQSPTLSPTSQLAVHSTYPVHEGAADRWRPSEGTGRRLRVGVRMSALTARPCRPAWVQVPSARSFKGRVSAKNPARGGGASLNTQNRMRGSAAPYPFMRKKTFDGHPGEARGAGQSVHCERSYRRPPISRPRSHAQSHTTHSHSVHTSIASHVCEVK